MWTCSPLCLTMCQVLSAIYYGVTPYQYCQRTLCEWGHPKGSMWVPECGREPEAAVADGWCVLMTPTVENICQGFYRKGIHDYVCDGFVHLK